MSDIMPQLRKQFLRTTLTFTLLCKGFTYAREYAGNSNETLITLHKMNRLKLIK